MSGSQNSETKKTDIGYEGGGENLGSWENLGRLSILKVSLNEVQVQTTKMGFLRMILHLDPCLNLVK